HVYSFLSYDPATTQCCTLSLHDALPIYFADEDTLEARLAAIERENMKTYGYGAKGFTLSMLQTALEVSEGNVSTKVLSELLEARSEEHTSELQSRENLVCRLLLEKKKKK